MTAPRSGGHDSYAAFRYPDYRRYIGMVSLSSIVQNGQTVAVGWDVYERTGSDLDLGWVGLVQFLAALFAFLPAGVIADSSDRRRTVSISFALKLDLNSISSVLMTNLIATRASPTLSPVVSQWISRNEPFTRPTN